MNGDGYDDFMGYITDEGMHAWLGGTNLNYAVPDFNMDPPWYGGEFQRSLEHGDFNDDGYEDAVGAQFGSGFVVWLGGQYVNGTSDYLQGNPGYENYGYSLVTGDFNADGYDDIAVAASHEYAPQPYGNFTGYVWVYGGNAQLADTTVDNDDPVEAEPPWVMSVYPNPFNPSTTIAFSIPETTQTRVSIYNSKGQRVIDLLDADLPQGDHSLVWDGRDTNNRDVASGIYFIKLEAGGKTSIRKAMLVK